LVNPKDLELQSELADSLHKCLSCSACTHQCPVQVDIPEMKSRFLEKYTGGSIEDKLLLNILGRFEQLLPIVSSLGKFGLIVQKIGVKPMSKLGIVDLPKVERSLATVLKKLDVEKLSSKEIKSGTTVLVLSDPFTSYLDTNVLSTGLKILKSLGEVPVLTDYIPSGKYDHVKGRRKRFAKAVSKQRKMIEGYLKTGLPIICLEPAVQLLYSNEYREFDKNFPMNSVQPFSEFLHSRKNSLSEKIEINIAKDLCLFSHCTELSAAPSYDDFYVKVFSSLGFDIQKMQTSCCGMAGVFGHEAKNQSISKKLFDEYWLPQIESNPNSMYIASGYSCRSQAKRYGHKFEHPVELLAEFLS